MSSCGRFSSVFSLNLLASVRLPLTQILEPLHRSTTLKKTTFEFQTSNFLRALAPPCCWPVQKGGSRNTVGVTRHVMIWSMRSRFKSCTRTQTRIRYPISTKVPNLFDQENISICTCDTNAFLIEGKVCRRTFCLNWSSCFSVRG